MKLLVILAVVAVAASAPQAGNLQAVQILRYESNNDGLGTYSFAYEQDDGSARQEQGELKSFGPEEEAAVVMRGSYTWIGPDGVTYTVNYIADDKGFQPTIDQGPGGAVPAGVVASLLG